MPLLLAMASRLYTARFWIWMALVAVAVIAVTHSRMYAGVVIDDAFITYRHALHVAIGQGFSCNPGERVEGTSSALFTLLMVLPIRFGLDPYKLAGWLGSLLLAGCTVIAYFMVRHVSGDRWGRALGIGAALLVAMSARLAFHSQTGMETLAYTFLIALAFLLHLRAVDDKPSALAWAWVMGLAALTRVEGVCFFGLLFVLAGLRRREAPGLWRRLLRELLTFLAVWGPLLVFRLLYFGRLVPMSVYAKRGATDWISDVPIGSAVRGLLLGGPAGGFYRFLGDHATSVVLLCGTLLLSRARYAGVAIACMIAGGGAVLVWNGGDWMPHDRLLGPYLPLLAVGTTLGLRALLFHGEQRGRGGHWPSFAATLAIFALVGASAGRPIERERVATVDLADARKLGEKLANVRRPDDVVASDMAGVLLYYWDARSIDMYGLCDAHVADRGRRDALAAGRADLAYVAGQRPTFYAFNQPSMARSFFQADFFAEQRSEYFRVEFPAGTFQSAHLAPALFVRKDRPAVDEVARALGARLIDAGAPG